LIAPKSKKKSPRRKGDPSPRVTRKIVKSLKTTTIRAEDQGVARKRSAKRTDVIRREIQPIKTRSNRRLDLAQQDKKKKHPFSVAHEPPSRIRTKLIGR